MLRSNKKKLSGFRTAALSVSVVAMTLAGAVQAAPAELSVRVLGSGGPIAFNQDGGRASAGYLISTDGKPRILMDVGGGTYQRLAESGVNIKDLDIVLLSHLHADHTGDLTSVIKTIYFHNNLARSQFPALPGRTAPINIYGPAKTAMPKNTTKPGFYYPNGKPVYMATEDYVDDHYSVKGGVEKYLTAFVAGISDDDGPMGEGGPVSRFAYTANDLSSKVPGATVETVLETTDGLVIKAIAVDHGPVPAVAYRIEYKGHVIAYSGDTGTKGAGMANMIAISQDADLLIYDAAILEQGMPPFNPLFHILHTQPSLIGAVARDANVDTLVLSHLTPVTSSRVDMVKGLIYSRSGFPMDSIEEANDLDVFDLGN